MVDAPVEVHRLRKIQWPSGTDPAELAGRAT